MAAEPHSLDCEICKHQHEFNLPSELMKEIVEGNVAIFAGAGVSTESRMVFKKTFYEDVMVYLGMNYPYERLNDANFPSLMQHLSSKPSGRIKLLEMIIKRFRTIDSFPELYGTATRFHRELGTLFPIKTIITTNWDEYFERECKATPFVYDHDMPFWQAARRKVLKIHGSITNLGSIIADREDYDRCTKELSTSLIGSKLKIILSEQTVVFIGYSLSDPDFMSVFDFVKGQIGRFQRQHYVVTPFENEAQRFRELGLIPIVTDDTYFIHVIKKQDGLSECLVKDSYEELAMTLRSRVLIEHNRLHSSVDFSFHPDAVYASFYQDGLMHALERSISMKGSGEYSHTCDLRELVKKYEEIAERKLSLGMYEDVAYIEGYNNGLIFILGHQDLRDSDVPLYHSFRTDAAEMELQEFLAMLDNAPQEEASFTRAKDLISRIRDPQHTEFHHPPWL